ncbi:MAG: ABC transporter permease [Alphaproteobacteria bacterium]|nr:ABC transporter permease [Alphaproteobacteria bacterium]
MKKDRSEKQAQAGDQVRIYVPDSRYSANPIEAIRELFKEVWSFRSHIAAMFGAEFRSSYRGTVFGVFWNFALPLVPLSVYILLVNLRVFPVYDGLNPAIYISFNVTIWSLLTGLITLPIMVVKSRNNESTRTAQPISVAVLASFARLFFDTFVRFALLCILIVLFAQWPKTNLLMLLPILLSGMVLCFSLGLMLAIFNVIIPDVERVVTIMLQYGVFVSGVIFPLGGLGPLKVLEPFNPFNVYIQALRDEVFFGHIANHAAVWPWAGVALLLFLMSMRFFYVMERRIRGIT